MENVSDVERKSFFQTNTARFGLIGVLSLFLLIPLILVQNIIDERKDFQRQVINEINEKWGMDLFFYGPILKVPYYQTEVEEIYDEATKRNIKKTYSVYKTAYFFPEELKSDADVTTEIKRRNNYESSVFTSKMNFSGKFLNFESLKKVATDKGFLNLEWQNASILIRTTNLKSIKELSKFNFLGKEFVLDPASTKEVSQVYTDGRVVESVDYYGDMAVTNEVSSLETEIFDISKLDQSTDFSFSVTYDGSQTIGILPIGKVTESKMKSNWNSPSFKGEFLPTSKEITKDGFTSFWKVLHINRPFSQENFGELPNISKYAFSVDFVIPVDEYQQNTRASKYGYLIIGLTFLVFFLIQVMSKGVIHIFQYTMIGLAMVMFYTLLISITEHSSFSFAYFISTLMVVLSIGLYSVSILKSKKFALIISVSLIALYGFIYVIIQLENYALLIGSLGLFAILAIIMYVSRKIEW